MPRWNSIFGKWIPAEEYAVDPRAPEGHEIYKGPDRAALLELKAQGVDSLGQDYHLNPDTIRVARTLGYKTVDEYLEEMFGFNKKEQVEKFEESKKKINKHEEPKRVKGEKIQGGGINMVRDSEKTVADMEGGFGPAPKV